MRRFAPLLVLSLAAACSQAPAASPTGFAGVSAEYASPAPVADAAETARVCRAAVAALFGKDPATMQVEQVEQDFADVRYVRADDGTVFRNRCRLAGDVVEWAGIDVYGPGTGLGRWRTDPADGHVTFATDGDRIAITQLHFDGSTSRDEFTLPR